MGKNYKAAKEKVDADKIYTIDEAIGLVPETKVAKFDESVDIAARLGVDPRHPEEMVRGTIILPNGTGKDVKILVIAKGEKESEAKEAGADFIGGEEMIEKIQSGWLGFDVLVSTPDMMGQVGKLGKVLGPRGLMPNPKIGTVTFDIKKAVSEIKAGKVEYKVDKTGIIHCVIGRVSFGKDKLLENFNTLMSAINRAKPSASKGSYLKSLTVSTSMGPGIKIDTAEVRDTLK